MDVSALYFFINIADGLTFAAVAEEGHISQSALSKMIIRLENELGVKLFDRNHRSVSLTLASQYFRDDLRKILPELEKATQRMRTFVTKKVVPVGVVVALAVFHLQEYLTQFCEMNPDIELVLSMINDTAGGLADMKRGKLSAIITHAPVRDTACDAAFLHDDALLAVLPKTHPCAGSASIRLEEFGENTILVARSTADTLKKLEADPDFAKRLSRVSYMDHITNQRDMVLSKIAFGHAVSIFHESSLRNFKMDDVWVCRIEDAPPTPLVFVTLKGEMTDEEGELLSYITDSLSRV